jgi:transposase-like protein
MADKKTGSLQWLRNKIEELDADLLREMLKAFAEFLMSEEVDGLCGAPYGQKNFDRLNHRNGYRPRRWDT